MSGLAMARAPAPQRPLRWLFSVPVWGMVAGGWLLGYGGEALASRWSPPALALTHLFTLGVLGNAILGSLLQFMPVAADCPLPLEPLSGALHAAFNLGLALFAPALAGLHPTLLGIAAPLLATPLLVCAATIALALLARGIRTALQAGIALSALALAATVGAGLLLVAGLRGTLAVPQLALTDTHAALGLAGWAMALVAMIGSRTLPMLQGTAAVPGRRLAIWLGVTFAWLALGTLARLAVDARAAIVVAIAVPALALAAASARLQRDAPHRRNPGLSRFWRLGMLAMAGAALLALAATAAPAPWPARLAGVLAVAVAPTLLVTGMLLEITGFLYWIALRRDCPRGVRVPGVDALLPETDKRRALWLHLAAAVALAAAALWPSLLARPAGAALLLAHAATLACLGRCRRRVRAFPVRAGGSP